MVWYSIFIYRMCWKYEVIKSPTSQNTMFSTFILPIDHFECCLPWSQAQRNLCSHPLPDLWLCCSLSSQDSLLAPLLSLVDRWEGKVFTRKILTLRFVPAALTSDGTWSNIWALWENELLRCPEWYFSKNVTWLTQGAEWPFRCLDFCYSFKFKEDHADGQDKGRGSNH